MGIEGKATAVWIRLGQPTKVELYSTHMGFDDGWSHFSLSHFLRVFPMNNLNIFYVPLRKRTYKPCCTRFFRLPHLLHIFFWGMGQNWSTPDWMKGKTGERGQNLRIPGLNSIKLRIRWPQRRQNDENNILYLRLQLGATVPSGNIMGSRVRRFGREMMG